MAEETGHLELKLANGKSKKFNTSYDMYKWAVQNDPKMEFNFSEKSGPFLCDFFDKLRKH